MASKNPPTIKKLVTQIQKAGGAFIDTWCSQKRLSKKTIMSKTTRMDGLDCPENEHVNLVDVLQELLDALRAAKGCRRSTAVAGGGTRAKGKRGGTKGKKGAKKRR